MAHQRWQGLPADIRAATPSLRGEHSALLLSPLPKSGEFDPAKDWLERYTVERDKVKVPCIHVVAKEASPGANASSSYCFDPKVPLVILRTNTDGMSAVYTQYARVQNLALPRSAIETVDNRRLLTLTLDSAASIDGTDRALAPPPDATSSGYSQVSSRVMNGKRTKGPPPEYPQKAKDARIVGTLILEAQVGKDGRIHDLEAVSSPDPLLTTAAGNAVSHWEYQPYLLNGEPVEVRRTIEVIYQMGR
ncbi:MAG TPA: energy transducer TonB [Acidobacteriaceae bacterium]|nr:energy transducer TonB [Acidobacteriaceae bacterium]